MTTILLHSCILTIKAPLMAERSRPCSTCLVPPLSSDALCSDSSITTDQLESIPTPIEHDRYSLRCSIHKNSPHAKASKLDRSTFLLREDGKHSNQVRWKKKNVAAEDGAQKQLKKPTQLPVLRSKHVTDGTKVPDKEEKAFNKNPYSIICMHL
jgi:hypothetical protein